METQFTISISQEGRFDTELTRAVVPNAGLVGRRRSYRAYQSKEDNEVQKYSRLSVDGRGFSVSPLDFDPEALPKYFRLESDSERAIRTIVTFLLLPFGRPTSSLVLASLALSPSQPSLCLDVSCLPQPLLRRA